jgi:hypothetical protein
LETGPEEAERELDAATRLSGLNAAAKKLMRQGSAEAARAGDGRGALISSGNNATAVQFLRWLGKRLNAWWSRHRAQC